MKFPVNTPNLLDYGCFVNLYLLYPRSWYIDHVPFVGIIISVAILLTHTYTIIMSLSREFGWFPDSLPKDLSPTNTTQV